MSLFCCNQCGELLDKIPREIKILKKNEWAEVSEKPLSECKKIGLKYYFFRMFASLWSRLFNKKYPAKVLCKKIKIIGEYDVAISYSQPIK